MHQLAIELKRHESWTTCCEQRIGKVLTKAKYGRKKRIRQIRHKKQGIGVFVFCQPGNHTTVLQSGQLGGRYGWSAHVQVCPGLSVPCPCVFQPRMLHARARASIVSRARSLQTCARASMRFSCSKPTDMCACCARASMRFSCSEPTHVCCTLQPSLNAHAYAPMRFSNSKPACMRARVDARFSCSMLACHTRGHEAGTCMCVCVCACVCRVENNSAIASN